MISVRARFTSDDSLTQRVRRAIIYAVDRISTFKPLLSSSRPRGHPLASLTPPSIEALIQQGDELITNIVHRASLKHRMRLCVCVRRWDEGGGRHTYGVWLTPYPYVRQSPMIASDLPTNFLVGDYAKAMMIVLASHISHNYAEPFVSVASTLGSGLVWREGGQHGNMACAPVYQASYGNQISAQACQ